MENKGCYQFLLIADVARKNGNSDIFIFDVINFTLCQTRIRKKNNKLSLSIIDLYGVFRDLNVILKDICVNDYLSWPRITNRYLNLRE